MTQRKPAKKQRSMESYLASNNRHLMDLKRIINFTQDILEKRLQQRMRAIESGFVELNKSVQSIDARFCRHFHMYLDGSFGSCCLPAGHEGTHQLTNGTRQ